MRYSYLIILALLLSCHPSKNYLRLAEKYIESGDIDNAINAYEHHMQERLAVTNRPDWENPYFYLILMGDLELKRGDSKAAVRNYDSAKENKVDPTLISDRIRLVGNWYEDHDQLNEAMELLNKYRELDTLLFDANLDRIAKKMVAAEQ